MDGLLLGPARITILEPARDLAAAARQAVCNSALDRRPGDGARLDLAPPAAAGGERHRTTRREQDAQPANRVTPFPGSPPAFERQGRRLAGIGRAWHRDRGRETRRR